MPPRPTRASAIQLRLGYLLTEFVSATSRSQVQARAARAPGTSGCAGNELIWSTRPSNSLVLSGTSWRWVASAARCAAVKSTFSLVRPPVEATCSMAPNHCGRSGGAAQQLLERRFQAPRSRSVSLRSNAMTLAIAGPLTVRRSPGRTSMSHKRDISLSGVGRARERTSRRRSAAGAGRPRRSGEAVSPAGRQLQPYRAACPSSHGPWSVGRFRAASTRVELYFLGSERSPAPGKRVSDARPGTGFHEGIAASSRSGWPRPCRPYLLLEP